MTVEPGMVLVPAGSFWMGCNTDVDGDCNGDEHDRHPVTIQSLWLDQTEVTVGAYQACVDAGVCDAGCGEGPNHPVACVTWQDAKDYCGWNGGKRLPSEAE